MLSDAVEMLRFLFVADDAVRTGRRTPPRRASVRTRRPLSTAAVDALEALPAWDAASIEEALKAALVDGLGLKPRKAFAPVRVAVTGRTVSPPLYESMELLGRDRSLERLRAAQ